MPSDKSPGQFLDEGKSYIAKGDTVQATEKLYKAAEEAIKILALTHAPEVHKEALGRERWTTDLLFKAADEMGREVRHWWDSAWTLHVQGFHEMKLNINSVESRIEDIAELVRLAEDKHLEGKQEQVYVTKRTIDNQPLPKTKRTFEK